jgi:yecA family protein
MLAGDNTRHLPDYQLFDDHMAVLELPMSSSELHGIMCGYICADASKTGELYLYSLVANKQKDNMTQAAMLLLYDVFAISQQQLTTLTYDFYLLLPADHVSITDRAKAFSDWCNGFIQGITLAGVYPDQFDEEDLEEAFAHLYEFAELDYEALDISETDEKALMEISEYARVAVIRLYNDLHANSNDSKHH